MQKWNSTTSNPFYINLVYTAFSNLIYGCLLIVLDCVYVSSGGQFCLFLYEWKSSYIRASCSKTCLSTISEHTDKASVYGGGSNLLLMCVWLSVQLPQQRTISINSWWETERYSVSRSKAVCGQTNSQSVMLLKCQDDDHDDEQCVVMPRDSAPNEWVHIIDCDVSFIESRTW